MRFIKPLNKRGFGHIELLVVIAFMAIFGFVGYRVMGASHAATGGWVCYIGPTFKDAAGMPWYTTTVQNQSGVATATLTDIAWQGQATASTFTWYGNNQYVGWKTGFSGTKIPVNGTVLGQVRQPTNPTGVGQGDWTFMVHNVKYKCATTTNATTQYNNFVKAMAASLAAKPAAPATPAPTPTPAPAPAPSPSPAPTHTFTCTATYTPTALVATSLPKLNVSVTGTNGSSIAADSYFVLVQERYSTATTTDLTRLALSGATLAKGAQTLTYAKTTPYALNGSKATVTLYASVVDRTAKIIDCQNGSITYNLKTGAGTVATSTAPASTAPKTTTTTTPKSSTTPTTPKTTPKPAPAPAPKKCTLKYQPSGSTVCTNSAATRDAYCKKIGQTWFVDDCHSAKYIASHQPAKKTFLPSNAAKKACTADGGKYTGNILKGWKCVYPKTTKKVSTAHGVSLGNYYEPGCPKGQGPLYDGSGMRCFTLYRICDAFETSCVIQPCKSVYTDDVAGFMCYN